MNRIICIAVVLLSITVHLSGQGVIVTDRPSQTYSVTVAPTGTVIVETGVLLERTPLDGGETFKGNTYGQTFIRYGLRGNMEFQFGTSYATQKAPGVDVSGLNPFLLGAKIKIAEKKDYWPAVSFIGNVTLPWIGDEDLRPENVAPDFRFIFEHSLSERFVLAYNLGMAWNGSDSNTEYLYTLLFGSAIVGDLGAYVELFGSIYEDADNSTAANVGLVYLLTDQIQLDLSYGLTFSDPGGHYWNFGASFGIGSARQNN